MRLLAGVLWVQGEAKVGGLLRAILHKLKPNASLAEQVRCAALLRAFIRDLSRMNYVPTIPEYQSKLQDESKPPSRKPHSMTKHGVLPRRKPSQDRLHS
jgi:hypothetical protein